MRTIATTHVNRTGLTLAPRLAAELIEGAEATQPSSEGDAELLAEVRIAYAQESEPLGTTPEPKMRPSFKAAADGRMLVLADKLGERLAFERSGTRLYESLISKHDAYGSWEGGPSRQDLQHIRDEEHEHFTMLSETIAGLGADPTVVTPSADAHAVASMGLCALVNDPRTDLRQSMEAILIAELVDNECWKNLIDLSRALGVDEVAEQFEIALEQEREHLENVRGWLGAALAGIEARATSREGNGGAPRTPKSKSASKKASKRKGP